MWIKPSELPKNFHGPCWTAYRKWKSQGGGWFPPEMEVVSTKRSGWPERWNDNQEYWDHMSDETYMVMLIDTPEVPND